MRKLQFLVICAAALMFAACGSDTKSKPATETEHHEGDGHTHENHDGHTHIIYYTCPDHQDVHQHEAGKCPKCQKDLVKKEEEGETHEGH